MQRERDMSLQGLLKFALKNTQKEDAASNEPSRPLTDEEKEFLENAFQTMTVDIIEEFRKAIVVLENDESSKDDKLNALNFVREQIDHIDFANSFIKVGGTNILLNIVEHDEQDAALRKNAIYIIAEMCQNNEFCQKHFLAVNVIPLLMSLFSDSNEDLATSALHAVSSLIRNFEAGLVEFLKLSGINTLLQHLNTPHSRFFTKLCFIIACLCANEHVLQELVKHNVIEKLYTHLDVVSGFDIKTETLLFAMSEVSNCDKWQPAAEFKAELTSTLQELVSVNKELAECEEITMYCNNILTKCK